MLQPGRLFPEAARLSFWTLVWPFQGEHLIGDAIVEIAKARDQAHGHYEHELDERHHVRGGGMAGPSWSSLRRRR